MFGERERHGGGMITGYFRHLRGCYSSGNRQNLVKINKQKQMRGKQAAPTWPCVCLSGVGVCKCVSVPVQPPSHTHAFFSSPLDFSALGRELYFRKLSLEISHLLGENLSVLLVLYAGMTLYKETSTLTWLRSRSGPCRDGPKWLFRRYGCSSGRKWPLKTKT